jgi:iron complex outermembrane receptor protein
MGAEESPMIVSATPQTVSELDTPAAVSVVSGDDMRQATPRINLSESLGSVPGLQIQNRQNYAQDLQLSMRGFGARSTFGVRGIRMYVDGIPATMPDGQGQTSNIDLSSVDSVEVLRGPFSALYGNASGGVININTQTGQQPPTIEASSYYGSYGTWRYGMKATGAMGDGRTRAMWITPYRLPASPPKVTAITAVRVKISPTLSLASVLMMSAS